MIHYHGGPITPVDVAIRVWTNRHALISFAYPEQAPVALEVAQNVVFDNGAFTLWKGGKSPDWEEYYEFISKVRRHPASSWALIPDVIDGTVEGNNRLVREWPHGYFGVPVWHLHEPIGRLRSLAEEWPRVALGSSGEYARPGTLNWWIRIDEALSSICDSDGFPITKLHGLRMLNPDIYRYIPFASVDSSSVARNIGLDDNWRGPWSPQSKKVRAEILVSRYEAFQSAAVWAGVPSDIAVLAVSQRRAQIGLFEEMIA